MTTPRVVSISGTAAGSSTVTGTLTARHNRKVPIYFRSKGRRLKVYSNLRVDGMPKQLYPGSIAAPTRGERRVLDDDERQRIGNKLANAYRRHRGTDDVVVDWDDARSKLRRLAPSPSDTVAASQLRRDAACQIRRRVTELERDTRIVDLLREAAQPAVPSVPPRLTRLEATRLAMQANTLTEERRLAVTKAVEHLGALLGDPREHG